MKKIFGLLLIFILVLFPTFAGAQGFSMSGGKNPSITEINAKNTFTSIEGRFTIWMPEHFNSYQPMTFTLPTGTGKGSAFSWVVDEGQFRVFYVDGAASLKDPKVAAQMLDALTKSTLSEIEQGGGKVRQNEKSGVDGNAAQFLALELKDHILFIRVLFSGTRMYQLFFAMDKKHQSKESVATKILDSFHLLSMADTEALIRKKIDEAMPAPLPQSPTNDLKGSDAMEAELSGKVKTVIEESEDLSGTWTISTRKRNSEQEFNEQGNLIRKVSYDYRGNPFEIQVYGYIDGDRVEAFKTIQYEYNPPPPMMAPAGAAKVKRDMRYGSKYKYKEDDQHRVIERLAYHNDGNLWQKMVINYKDKQKEILFYDQAGKLYGRYVRILDQKGNSIEYFSYDEKSGKINYHSRDRHEFDEKGNWIKRISEDVTEKDGKEIVKPSSVTYRKITYYR